MAKTKPIGNETVLIENPYRLIEMQTLEMQILDIPVMLLLKFFAGTRLEDTGFTGPGLADAGWIQSAGQDLSQLLHWLDSQYSASPALFLGIAIALTIPLLAGVGAVIRYCNPTPAHSTGFVADTEAVHTIPASAWRQRAWLETPDTRVPPFRIIEPIVRIGRASDNDLCLPHETVHRYHAVIERTPEAEFYISYTGDPGHAGLIVDGHVVKRARLRGGEVLLIGAAKVRFMAGTA